MYVSQETRLDGNRHETTHTQISYQKAQRLAPGAFQPSKNSIFAPWAVSAIKNNFRPSYKYEIESIRDLISERTQGQPQPGARYDTIQHNAT